MGTPITDVLITKELKIEDLKGKTLAVDAFNMLYQFLSTIRQRDGSLLMDSKGHVTSHLIGLFSRVTKLMIEDLKLVFVFDGIVPKQKFQERERRKDAKILAQKKYEEAKQEENVEDMKKFASRTSRLNSEMIEDAKKLITALGMPIVDAASEGEAQASYMVKQGDCYAIISQDTDSLVFGATRVVKNLTLGGKRKGPGQFAYKTVNPVLIILEDNLKELKLSQDQLIVLAMLAGTDYNIGGVKGIGPKKGLKLLYEHGEDFETIFKEAGWDENFNFPWKEIFDLFKNMPITKDYELEWKTPDKDALVELLVKGHDFGLERVEKTVDKLLKGKPNKQQKSLFDF